MKTKEELINLIKNPKKNIFGKIKGIYTINTDNCMSNLRLNIRILMWHIQISYNWKINVTYNDYHKGLNYGWFAVYEYKRLFESSKNFDRDNAA